MIAVGYYFFNPRASNHISHVNHVMYSLSKFDYRLQLIRRLTHKFQLTEARGYESFGGSNDNVAFSKKFVQQKNFLMKTTISVWMAQR